MHRAPGWSGEGAQGEGGDSGHPKVSQAPGWTESSDWLLSAPVALGPARRCHVGGATSAVPRRWCHVGGILPWPALQKAHSMFALSLRSCCFLPPYLMLFSGPNGIEVVFFTQRCEQGVSSCSQLAGWDGPAIDSKNSGKLLRMGSESAGTFVPRHFEFPEPEQSCDLVGHLGMGLKWVLRGLFWPQTDSRAPQ